MEKLSLSYFFYLLSLHSISKDFCAYLSHPQQNWCLENLREMGLQLHNITEDWQNVSLLADLAFCTDGKNKKLFLCICIRHICVYIDDMSHHDFLEYGIPISSLCDRCVLMLLAESGLLQIFKMLCIRSKLKNTLPRNLGKYFWNIPASSFWAPYSNYCVEMVFCEVWHPNFPQDAHRKDCCEEPVCIWQLPTSELRLCSLPVR